MVVEAIRHLQYISVVLSIRCRHSWSVVAGEHHACLFPHCSNRLGVLRRHAVVISNHFHSLLGQSITSTERISICVRQ